MNKLLLALAGLAMLLATTGCGNDEPQDHIWYAQIPLVYHVVDSRAEAVSSCKTGRAYAEMNVDKHTATLAASVVLADGEELAFELTQLDLAEDAAKSGYVVSSSREQHASGHTLSELTFYVDMRQSGTVRHYFHMVVDNRYEVNGLPANMGFEVTQSTVKPATGGERAVSTGVYEFSITALTSESKRCDFGVSGLSVYPLEKGISYAGLTLEPTVEGYTIASGDSPLTPKESGNHPLNSLQAKVNVHTRTVAIEFDIENCATVSATGSMQ